MTCADCHTEGADCLTADRVRVCSDCLYERVVKERDEARAEAARLTDVLRSKHGGEPLALLDELDEARDEIARLKKRFDDQWYECHDGSEQACCKSHE